MIGIIIFIIAIIVVIFILSQIKNSRKKEVKVVRNPAPQKQNLPPFMQLKPEEYMEPKFRYAPNLSHQKHFVVFDFETTGTDPRYCEIIEIGAIKYSEGEIIDRFQTFVKPYFPIPAEATSVNNITNEMVMNAPPPERVIPQFLEFIGDSKLMGYNIAKFDFIILRRYAYSICGNILDNMITDVYKMSLKKLSLNKYRLTDVANHFHITPSNAHRAIGDCETTLECFKRLQEIYKKDLEYRKAHKNED